MRSAGFIALFACFLTAQVLGSPHKNDIRTYYGKLGKAKNVSISGTCTECKFVASELKNVISDPAKLERVKMVLKFMCDYLGGSEVQECKNIIDNLDFFAHELEPYLDDPEQFCKEIHLCGVSRIPLYSHAALYFFKFVVRTANATRVGDILCDECIFAMTELNTLLENADVQQQLKKELEQICQILRSLQHQCNEFVEGYFPFALKLVQELLKDPKHLCSEIQMCPKSRPKIGSSMEDAHRLRVAVFKVPVKKVGYKHKMTSRLSVLEPAQKKKVEKAVCMTCQHGVKSFQQLLKEKKSLISSKLNGVICNVLPDDLAQDCGEFAGSYAGSLILMAIDDWIPQEICVNSALCASDIINDLPVANSSEYLPALCEACHTLADFIGFEVGKEALQQQIIDMIKDDLCPLLPGDLSAQCAEEADDYVRKLAAWIVNYVRNPKFCKEVWMCQENRQAIPQ